jgi:hypothetical protein
MKALPGLVFALCSAATWAAQPVSPPPAPAAAAASLQGQVLETKDADPYTYLRLRTGDGEVWAAVTKTSVKPGASVTIRDPLVMTDFRSTSLNRTFDRIVFGTLAGTNSAHGPMPASPGAPASMAPHPMPQQAPEITVVKVPTAPGGDGRTVAEVYAQGAKLKGKTVAVAGTVVKVTNSIMGRNWVHVRDGTGSARDGSNDLIVTTKQAAKVGDVVTARGVVETDVDLGMGYTYRVLVGNATLKE